MDRDSEHDQATEVAQAVREAHARLRDVLPGR